MAGILKSSADPFGDRHRLAVFNPTKQGERSFHIRRCVEGFDRRQTLLFVFFAEIGGILFMDMSAIAQQHFTKVNRRSSRIDRTGKTSIDQIGYVAAVIDMCVGQQQSVDLCRIKQERLVALSAFWRRP